MAPQEFPRVTSMLRTFTRSDGQRFDLGEETRSLFRLLQDKRAIRDGSVMSSQQTWKSFSEKFPTYPKSSDLYDSFIQLQGHFFEFEKNVQELFEVNQKQAGQYVGFILDLVEDEKTSEEKMINRITITFGKKSDQLCRKILRLASDILDEKKDLLLRSGIKDSKEKVSNRPFGIDLEYTDPFGSTQKQKQSEAPSSSEAQLPSMVELVAALPQYQRKTTEPSPASKYDIFWLYYESVSAISSTGSTFSPAEMIVTIIDMLRSTRTDESIQEDLFNIIGFDSIEFIEKILSNRSQVIKNFDGQINKAKQKLLSKDGDEKQARPVLGPSVTIRVESGRASDSSRKKDGKSKGTDNSQLIELIEQIISFGPDLFTQPTQKVLMPEGTLSTSGFGDLRNLVLPLGTERIDKKTHEEVHIPPYKSSKTPDEKLVAIAQLDDVLQLGFKGYSHLNRIQSKLFKAAYYSNENLLICAPTGAGKTNIAMLTILREVRTHMRDGAMRRGDHFKIVYIAPMKALAAEMVRNFGGRLSCMGLVVKELTGDMQLTRAELSETHIIVTTPEKWDVITRKSSDVALTQMVKLLIIDEVHLLNEDRGPVIESLVARTLRQVESSQSMIRIVGLSATLPNYQNVATFLRVNLTTGLFHFDNSYRPVPLHQQFIGVKEQNSLKCLGVMNEICYEKMLHSLRQGNQVMIFVHSRKDTGNVARVMRELSQKNGTTDLLDCSANPRFHFAQKEMGKSRNKELRELFESGLAIHHAGMLRSDRNIVERFFSEGLIKVLCCTATLAWGVNLPVHTVIIRGTKLYNPQAGGFTELGVLDVMQIFGRAGRPQFDTSGEGIIITTHDKLSHFLSLMNHQMPIESKFGSHLEDNLNAEIVLGTVNNIAEAVEWLSYTYFYVRMLKNPLVYGISGQEKEADPDLSLRRADLIRAAATELDKCQMIRFNSRTGSFGVTDLGRIASHYYVDYLTIKKFNELLNPQMTEEDVLFALSQAHEFENIKLRDDEMDELKMLELQSRFIPRGGAENEHGKTNILLQAHVSRIPVQSFSLTSDSSYVTQNSARLFRAMFEIAMKKGWTSVADKFLDFCKSVEKQLWPTQHPLWQFPTILTAETVHRLEDRDATMDRLMDMTAEEIGALVRIPKLGPLIRGCIDSFPRLEMSVDFQPITRTVLRIQIEIVADFVWNDKVHGSVEPWWIYVEDGDNETIHHIEQFMLFKKQKDEVHKLCFTIPIFEPLPPQYYVRAVSDRWIGAETLSVISFQSLILPDRQSAHTELLNLDPLPLSVLGNTEFQSIFKFTHFNPVQTQFFYVTYHTDNNILLGAPTGSGKTVCAELCTLRVMKETPGKKVIYIAPLKALVRERMKDWKRKFVDKLGKTLVELTGDVNPDIRALKNADIVCTTPEKWDGISRNWQSRGWVKNVALVIIDEIHLLGQDRGPILEVIVSRMRYISSQIEENIRIVGLSTALANARDLGDWLGIENVGLFNFRPSVRPVPLDVHIQGYPGKNYCPRMKVMNKPTYTAIKEHSVDQPVLVFVSSRRQTRLTAFDLISFSTISANPKEFLHMPVPEMEELLLDVKDESLRQTLSFGIGLHHAGLTDGDRSLVEELYLANKIQILVSTSTLAWGVNLPAHLVVIKGTEFFDAKTQSYVDFPITDVLQMMGRAGRPQFDNEGKVVILVHEPKKSFYKKFLYEPFPVESSLAGQLHNHLNAEIASGTIIR
eukprot:TRINITY_DN10590_c0_g1_i1.p1 TRINITY_DN10590_c0_g1~~TRINITY_DN10590_c0_g1_i1.p1  ORF type:complete len:1715 (+),score=334.69 TRINITY_DN10590_c0_g1_i1:82-5226(+)